MKTLLVTAVPLALALLGGCTTHEPYRFVSYPLEPKTITLTDVTTGHAIWSYEVPVGQQLNLKFSRSRTSSEKQGYDEMTWSVSDIGRSSGGGKSSKMRVPPASSRRIEMEVRAIPEARRNSLPPGAVGSPARPAAMPSKTPEGVVLPDPKQPAPK